MTEQEDNGSRLARAAAWVKRNRRMLLEMAAFVAFLVLLGFLGGSPVAGVSGN